MSEPTSRGSAKPLAFPSLITELCKMQGVDISFHPRKKLRLSIKKTHIQTNCTNELDNMGVDITPHPRKKLRLPINKTYIQTNYINELDNVQGLAQKLHPNARA